MALYDKPVRLLFWDMVADISLKKGEVLTKQQVIDWFGAKYPRVKQGTIAAHLIRLSVNAPSRHHYNAKAGEDDLFYQIDGSHFRLYDAAVDRLNLIQNEEPLPEIEPEEAADTLTGAEFAYERDLKHFLAKNLSLVEPGLRLFEEEGITGLEFPVGGRFIDILAIDAQGNFVVIELKVSKGYDRVVGQLLRYMAWIAQNQAEPYQQVRGVIVAREISEDLRLACSRVVDVSLFEYELAVTLRRIN
jgi:endonuclease